jgi:UDP-N-acetylmuramate dehydrogenase
MFTVTTAEQKPTAALLAMRLRFGARLQADVRLARYTAARVGGPADWLVEVETGAELQAALEILWADEAPVLLLGGGSNVLVSDAGVRGVTVINKARNLRFEEWDGRPALWAESGVNFGLAARQAAANGLSGLEWAVGIPGTIGGAVYGNAGAHGADMAGCLVEARILQRSQQGSPPAFVNTWSVEQLDYSYRSSALKRNPDHTAVLLDARLRLGRSTPELVQARTDELNAYRKRTQPPGASMGSMFKNPPGDYAGRLIEAAGLKGLRRGDVQISPVHANFFVNGGRARAADIYALADEARRAVNARFGVDLELEIELVGDWSAG